MQASNNPGSRDAVHRAMLDLGIPAHKVGFEQLHLAIVRFSQDKMQTMTKEIYPFVARSLGCSSWRAVERSIRDAIGYAWVRRDLTVWANYFPKHKRPPSNKSFIAAVAEKVN